MVGVRLSVTYTQCISACYSPTPHTYTYTFFNFFSHFFFLIFCFRQLTQITCNIGLCSLLLMKDGVSMVAGGSDGKQLVVVIVIVVIVVCCMAGNLYFYNLKNCKKPEYTLNGYKGHPVITMALQNTLKVRLINYW